MEFKDLDKKQEYKVLIRDGKIPKYLGILKFQNIWIIKTKDTIYKCNSDKIINFELGEYNWEFINPPTRKVKIFNTETQEEFEGLQVFENTLDGYTCIQHNVKDLYYNSSGFLFGDIKLEKPHYKYKYESYIPNYRRKCYIIFPNYEG